MKTILTIVAVLVAVSMVPTVLSAGTENPIQPNQGFIVPSWIKNNAGWWADGLIDDSSFVSGIQWLISNDVITIPPTEQGTGGGDNVIPGWIKNSAGWWADDKIHDVVFIGGIKYLINEGIMIIEQESEQVEEPVEEPVKEPVEEPIKEPVEEIKETSDFYMRVNGDNCCVSWAYVDKDYYFQIETFDKKRGNYIDGVKINIKITSEDSELRHEFDEVITQDGIYKNPACQVDSMACITIPSIDWYGINILSITAEYHGVEKVIEKEFTVFPQTNPDD